MDERVKSKVAEFVKAMGLEDRGTEFWDALVEEEYQEFMKEYADLTYVLAGRELASGVSEDLFVNVNALEKAFDIVHQSNMSKLWGDGRPRYDENGKVIKPPHYVKPDMSGVGRYGSD